MGKKLLLGLIGAGAIAAATVFHKKENLSSEEREKVEQIVIEEMQNAYPLNVPLIADAGWGKNWLEAH